MIIGLNGNLKSGKDTTYQIIKEYIPDAIQISFAEKLKRSAAASLGISMELLEELKADEHIYFSMHNHHNLTYHTYDEARVWRMNMREYLQWYGTEAHRDIFGDDFWVDQALPINTQHRGSLLVVTDMRFPNEFERVEDLGGTKVKVVRTVPTKHSSHESEQNQDHLIDIFLDNESTIGNLRNNVIQLLCDLDLVATGTLLTDRKKLEC